MGFGDSLMVVLILLWCLLVGIGGYDIYTASDREAEAIAVQLQQEQDNENQISEIIYKSNLTQSETIELIGIMCNDNFDCKTNLYKKHIVKR